MKNKKDTATLFTMLGLFAVLLIVRVALPNEVILDDAENPTIFGKALEFATMHKVGIANILQSTLVVLATAFLRSKINTIQLDTTATATEAGKIGSSQDAVAKAVNALIDSNSDLSEKYTDYGNLENDRNKVSGAVLLTNTAILEILTTVYSNSKNLPQGVKDLVNLKYANCLTALQNDDQLSSLVKLVRGAIGDMMTTEGNNGEADV